jgi:hypothetical protein
MDELTVGRRNDPMSLVQVMRRWPNTMSQSSTTACCSRSCSLGACRRSTAATGGWPWVASAASQHKAERFVKRVLQLFFGEVSLHANMNYACHCRLD